MQTKANQEPTSLFQRLAFKLGDYIYRRTEERFMRDFRRFYWQEWEREMERARRESANAS